MFAVVVEHNHKERESFVFYCQWKGNERELAKLFQAIEASNPNHMGGDYSSFSCSWGLVSEEAVDAHVALRSLGNYSHMFQKCVGKFVCPVFSLASDAIAEELDKHFYGCRLGDFFKA